MDTDIRTIFVTNKKNEKYSLRPRANNNNHINQNQNNKKAGDDDIEFESWKPRNKTKRRVKQKPAPLSKYRRKTANARERCRMREINDGFEALRKVLPHLSSSNNNNNNEDENNNYSNEKLTKISTLRFAMKYISALNRLLHDPTTVASGDTESDGESSFFSEYTLTPPDNQPFTPPQTFSENSMSTDFSDQMLSPQMLDPQILSPTDFSGSFLPVVGNLVDGFSSSTATSSCCSSSEDNNNLNNNNCFSISDLDFVDSTTLTNNCLPEISFDDTSYIFDDSIYIGGNFS